MQRGSHRTNRDAGYAYLAMLAVVAAFAAVTAAAGVAWESAAKRAREQQLLRVGAAYAAAIDSYRRHAPGSVMTNPSSLDDLLSDSRFPRPVRHLRRLYPDPIDPKLPWTLIRDAGGRIAGIQSSSVDEPLRITPVDLGVVQLPAARRYADWKFMVQEKKR